MTTTTNIQWIIQNCTEENLKKVNTNNWIKSPIFHVNVCSSVLKWCLATCFQKNFHCIYLCKKSPKVPQDFTINFTCKIEQTEKRFRVEYQSFEYSYGIPWFITLEDVLKMLKADPNKSNSITMNIKLEITPKEANKPKSPAKSNVLNVSFAEYLNDEEASDVTFKCSDGIKVHAHKILLMQKSAVFKKILTAMKAQRKKIEVLDDVDSPTLKEILKHIYSGNANLDNIKLIAKVYPASVKFDLPELQLQCVDSLSNQLNNPEKILDIFDASVELELVELEEKALSCILKNFHNLKTTPKWRNLAFALKEKILDACSGYIPAIFLKSTL